MTPEEAISSQEDAGRTQGTGSHHEDGDGDGLPAQACCELEAL